MNFVFTDTLYWVASILPNDPWHEPALRAAVALGKAVHLVTTQEMLTEVLSACAGRGELLRDGGSAYRAWNYEQRQRNRITTNAGVVPRRSAPL